MYLIRKFFLSLIISTTVLFITRSLWNLGLTWVTAFFAPFLNDLIDWILSAMEGFPLSVGDDGSGASSSKQPRLPDLNQPPAEEDLEDPHGPKEKDFAQALLQLELQKIEAQKENLAELIRPLIEEEASRYRSRGSLPSPREIVEHLINRSSGCKRAQAANAANPAYSDLRYLKTWLTRACKSAQDDGRGNMSVKTEIQSILRQYLHNDGS